MSAHLPQPAQFPGYGEMSAYLAVPRQGHYEWKTHGQHMVNSTHLPPIQTNRSPYEEFAPQQSVPARSSAVSSLPANDSLQDADDREQQRDKEAIYAHPLFPLLELLFEKCEQATTMSWEQDQSSNTVNYALYTVNAEIAAFTQKMRSNFPYYSPQPDVDALMIQAVQTLRFHLMELEKVHELCHSFCERYVSCLKGKMPMDMAINSDREFCTFMADQPPLPLTGMAEERSPDFLSDHQMFGSVGAATPTTPSDTGLQESGLESTGITVGSPRLLVSPSGTPSGSSTMAVGHGQHLPLQIESASSTGENDLGSAGSDEVAPREKTKAKKRGIFPKSATNIMKAWLFQHLSHPYPSEEQKRQLAQETHLTILQVNNWFINARRRIVQPMIDASNRAGKPTVVSSHGMRTPNPGSPSPLQLTGLPPYQPGLSLPVPYSVQVAGSEPLGPHTMMPQGASQPQAVMPMSMPPPLKQDTNIPLPLTHLPPPPLHLPPPPLHLPPQGMAGAPPGMMHSGIGIAPQQTAYAGMMSAHSVPLQHMYVPCPPQQMMPHQAVMPSSTHLMAAIPTNTMVSPPCTIRSPPPLPQPTYQPSMDPQGYMAAATVPPPQVAYHMHYQYAPSVPGHLQQQQ